MIKDCLKMRYLGVGLLSLFFSILSPPFILAIPASPPTNIQLTNETWSSLTITFDMVLNDCTPQSSQPFEFLSKPSVSLDLTDCTTNTDCIIAGLASNTTYSFKIRIVCEVFSDTSQYSEWSDDFTTLIHIASTPVNIIPVNATLNTISLSWDDGGADYDCIFDDWVWEISPSVASAMDICNTISRDDDLECEAFYLDSDTYYSFRVMKTCTNSEANSEWSEWSESFSTLYTPATPPFNVELSSPTSISLEITWTNGTANDCIFSNWNLTLFTGSMDNFMESVAACIEKPRTDLKCLIVSLKPETTYQFGIREQCSNDYCGSEYAITNTISTLAESKDDTNEGAVIAIVIIGIFTIGTIIAWFIYKYHSRGTNWGKDSLEMR